MTIGAEFAKALVKVQGDIEGAIKGNANPQFRSKYADLGACWEACRAALQGAQIAVVQAPEDDQPGRVAMVTTLVHGPSGETWQTRFSVPVKDPSNPQALGSAITYARRYALCSVIGICPVDDDGNAASKAPKASPDAMMTTAWCLDIPKSLNERWFSNCNKSERKALYAELRNTTVAEPLKTETLNRWAEVIKNMKDEGAPK